MKMNLDKLANWIENGDIRYTIPAFGLVCGTIIVLMCVFFEHTKPVHTSSHASVRITKIKEPSYFEVSYVDIKTNTSYSESKKYCDTWNKSGLNVGDTITIDRIKVTQHDGDVYYYYDGAVEYFCK